MMRIFDDEAAIGINTERICRWPHFLYFDERNNNFEFEYINKSTLDNSPPPLLNLKCLRPQGQIIDVKCEKSQ